ncbi:MAG: gliding motility-associated C-terminal domain-containing protein [Bacteroidales bacterium]|nr:gliding motility-associated C-terminal domain-containing protein [Bacteroidales bacterium]
MVQVTDECGYPFGASLTAFHPVLALDLETDAGPWLSWSAYDGFGRLPDGYRVYRKEGSLAGYQLLDELSPVVQRYAVPLEGLSTEEFRYRVSAFGGNAELPYQEECFSNAVSSIKEPAAYIPNSFIPESDIAENRVFKPVLRQVDEAGYTLLIFDRWGQVVFESHRPDEGWDGTIKGKPARMGVYVYQLTCRLHGEKSTTRRGLVNLIR